MTRELSKMERVALVEVARGLTSTESAERSGVKPGSIESRRSRLFSKLGARNAPHAVALGFARGIFAPDDLKGVGDSEEES